MSRIHDALKKAEQEREAVQGEGLLPTAELRPSAVPTGTGVSGGEENLHPRLSVDALLAHCGHHTWTPQPKFRELFGASSVPAGAEELRTLRSRLYQIRDRQPLRTVLITSAMPGEGKTFLTASLAHMIVRQHERRVLIIDADLRRSQLHDALGAPLAPGLTEYLSGAADECAVLQRGMSADLFLISGGKAVSNPTELLANGRLKALLERLSPAFDWILIDSPPVVPVYDASVLAGFCDGVLLVVQAAKTAADLAQKAREELKDKGLLGVVLNQVDEGQTYHSYYYHYYGHNGSKRKK